MSERRQCGGCVQHVGLSNSQANTHVSARLRYAEGCVKAVRPHIGTGNGERATGSVEHHAKHKGKGHKKSAEHYGQRRRGFDFHNGGSEQARRDEFAIQCAWRFV